MKYFNSSENKNLIDKLASQRAGAKVAIQGGQKYPESCGEVLFFEFDDVVVLSCYFSSLPQTATNIFALHIHQNGECAGDFTSADNHYGEGEHPLHKGDLPPIFSCNGNAFSVFATNRFKLSDVIGKSVILHLNPDDFTSQPSGNSGERIACGIIER